MNKKFKWVGRQSFWQEGHGSINRELRGFPNEWSLLSIWGEVRVQGDGFEVERRV